MNNTLKPFTSLISCYAVLLTSLLSFYPSSSWACTSEDMRLIAPSCKSYQVFSYELCACEDKEGHDEETRKNIQKGFDSCIADDNSQECHESLASATCDLVVVTQKSREMSLVSRSLQSLTAPKTLLQPGMKKVTLFPQMKCSAQILMRAPLALTQIGKISSKECISLLVLECTMASKY